jgi:phosphatidylglycerol:prolipoprotein diacylglycerol transferase
VVPFPAIDPIAFHFFGLAIYWYALAYVVGILLGFRCMLAVNARLGEPFSKDTLESFINWAIVGIIFGGRLGHMFYEPEAFCNDPLYVFAIRQGGMSFHGGLLGVLVVAWVFSRKKCLCFWRFVDLLAVAAPIGLFLGRLANFVNGELYGRPTALPWGIVFPGGGPTARHPSQLYEAFFEGLILWSILWGVLCWHKHKAPLVPGRLTGVFALGYGVMREALECVRAPDSLFNEAVFKTLHITLGQILSLPLIAIGFWLLYRENKCTVRR